MKVESLHRAWPPQTNALDDPLANFLRLYFKDALLSVDSPEESHPASDA
jgi:hypothetical protein